MRMKKASCLARHRRLQRAGIQTCLPDEKAAWRRAGRARRDDAGNIDALAAAAGGTSVHHTSTAVPPAPEVTITGRHRMVMVIARRRHHVYLSISRMAA